LPRPVNKAGVTDDNIRPDASLLSADRDPRRNAPVKSWNCIREQDAAIVVLVDVIKHDSIRAVIEGMDSELDEISSQIPSEREQRRPIRVRGVSGGIAAGRLPLIARLRDRTVGADIPIAAKLGVL